MSFVLMTQSAGLGASPDRGTLALVAALFLVSILAHRLWRGKIRAEDEVLALRKDQAFSQGRYRAGFRALGLPAAFADRATGLVMEATPGWVEAGLLETGQPVWSREPAAEAVWREIPPPSEDGRPAPSRLLQFQGQALRATPLGGESLGVVLLERV